jgi:hypothetical protein
MPPWMSSIRGNARVGFVIRDVNAAMNIRRYLAPKKRTEELKRFNVAGKRLRLVVYRGKLKPGAFCRSKNTGKRL